MRSQFVRVESKQHHWQIFRCGSNPIRLQSASAHIDRFYLVCLPSTLAMDNDNKLGYQIWDRNRKKFQELFLFSLVFNRLLVPVQSVLSTSTDKPLDMMANIVVKFIASPPSGSPNWPPKVLCRVTHSDLWMGLCSSCLKVTSIFKSNAAGGNLTIIFHLRCSSNFKVKFLQMSGTRQLFLPELPCSRVIASQKS